MTRNTRTAPRTSLLGATVTTVTGLAQVGQPAVPAGFRGVVVGRETRGRGLFAYTVYTVEWQDGRRTEVVNANLLLTVVE